MGLVEELSDSEISELQKVFFEEISKYWRETNNFPMTVTVAGVVERTLEDLRDLREKSVLNWDLEMKRSPFMGVLPSDAHKVECVVYYGNREKNYCCIGYAFGCINFKTEAFELHFIEKRTDCGEDWERKFFPLIVQTFAGYITLINSKYDKKIDKFVIVSPLDDVKRYYREKGFELLRNHKYSQYHDEVMVKYLISPSS